MGTHTKADLGRAPDRLGDFTADSRVVLLSLMAIIIGVLSAFVATALVWLINTVTNTSHWGPGPLAECSPHS
jgi:hypothetical protein